MRASSVARKKGRVFFRHCAILFTGAFICCMDVAAQTTITYLDESAFLANVNSPALIDFEGLTPPDVPLYLGTPGQFQQAGVTINSNSQMFVQNINGYYGTGSFLSPQGVNPQTVQFTLPPNTIAVGFSYSYANYASVSASVEVGGSGAYSMPAEPFGAMGFFGVTRDAPIAYMTVTVEGGAFDIDNVWFLIDPDAPPPDYYVDETTFLAAVTSPTLIDFEGIADPGGSVYLGNPGVFAGSGVTITNNSQMFVQNNDYYGTASFLSPQGANPHVVQIVLPPNTTAVGFSYSSAAATALLGTAESFNLAAQQAGSLGFFGVVRSAPILYITLTVDGPGVDIDNFWFVVDGSLGGGGTNVPGGGNVDTNFGVDGVLFLDDLLGSDFTFFEGLAIQPSGKIIVAGIKGVTGQDPLIAVARLDLSGALDATFGVDGVRTLNTDTGSEQLNDVTVLSDGSILIVGGTGSDAAGQADSNSLVVKLDVDGDFDASFGNGGVLINDLSPGFYDSFERIRVQDDGKLLLGTQFHSVYRLLADGGMDLNFGFGGRAPRLCCSWAAFGVAQNKDGTIVFGGGSDFSDAAQDFLVMKYVADGIDMDNSFGANGVASIPLGPANDTLIDLVLDAQERIVALGFTTQGGSRKTAVVRLLPNGAADPSFGTNGIQVLDIPNHTVLAKKIVMRPDGGMLVAGRTLSASSFELVVISLNADGSLDESFAGQGWQGLDVAPDSCCIYVGPDRSGLEIHPQGKIIAMDWECGCLVMLEAPAWNIRNGDQNGDGNSDILFRNNITGANQLYVMNGATIAQNLPVSAVAASWTAVGRGDYNGDGRSDILWRYTPTGALWIYFMDGRDVVSSQFVGTISDANWKVVGNGDYNGDGKSDILWHHALTGTVWLYEMHASTVSKSTGIGVVPNIDWQIVGSGDYNGDLKADLLWRNVVTGTNWMYLMNGAAIVNSTGVSVVPDPNWKIVGNGDFNGDGKSDILWRNIISGTNWMYLMNGTSIMTSASISVLPDTNWKIVGDGDYNGDGKADVLWRNLATGSNYMYLMNGLTITSNSSIGNVPDQNWQIVNTR